MRCDTKQHPVYGGIDWQARSMDVCILSHEGDMLLHRPMKAAPEPCLKAMAPSREGLVVAVDGLFTWDLAGRLVCGTGSSLCPGSRPLHASPPWRQGHTRSARCAKHGRPAARGYAPASLG
jgi:hypothetical protein